MPKRGSYQCREMKIVVNGDEYEFEDGITVTNLLQSLNLPSEQVAVEINLTILDRSHFPTWTLAEGDRVEVMSFIGGGCLR